MTYKIVVDADACPVKAEIVQTAAKFGVGVLMVASFDHLLQPAEGVEIVQVDRSDQSVDLYIANRISAGDVLITQDFGVAMLGLGRRAIAMSNRGQMYSDRTIGFLLERRHEQAKLRRGESIPRSKSFYGRRSPSISTNFDKSFISHAGECRNVANSNYVLI